MDHIQTQTLAQPWFHLSYLTLKHMKLALKVLFRQVVLLWVFERVQALDAHREVVPQAFLDDARAASGQLLSRGTAGRSQEGTEGCHVTAY